MADDVTPRSADPRAELRAAAEVWPDAMRMNEQGDLVPQLERCDGECHEVGYDECSLCCSFGWDLMCNDCVFYALQDAEPINA